MSKAKQQIRHRGVGKKTLLQRFEEKYIPEPNTGCWLFWFGTTAQMGYGRVYRSKRSIRATHVSYELFKGKVPKGKMVLHTCDVRCCVNPDHLYVGTRKQNMKDARERHRMAGERNGGATLTAEKVIAIRNDPRSQVAISREYKINFGTVSKIKLRTRWKHV